MSDADPVPQAAAVQPPSAPRPPRRPLFARAMFVVALLVGLWIGWQEAPREIARWYLAAAVEHRVQAKFDGWHDRAYEATRQQGLAEAAIERALAWNSKDGSIYLERASWNLEDGDYPAALTDCDHAAKVIASPQGLAEKRGTALLHLKRYDEAVKEAQRFYDLLVGFGHKEEARFQLNQIAYFRSLGKVDLPQALKEIDESLQGVQPAFRDSARLDTRGFILYQMGRHAEAIGEFDLAVRRAEAEIEVWTKQKGNLVSAIDPRDFEIERRRFLANYGIIYYHRSLVLEKLNRWKEAHQTRLRAKELLGREPDDSVF